VRFAFMATAILSYVSVGRILWFRNLLQDHNDQPFIHPPHA
jgi:hypothetical protein